MKLYAPLEITSRLLPGVRVGGATLSLGLGAQDRQGRTCYECWIDLPDGSEHEITDLRSGSQGGNIKEGLTSLLAFLGAAAESRAYRRHTREAEPDPDGDEGLFAPAIVDWADAHSDELSMLGCELEETDPLVED